jgi:hypothetical protein
MAPRYAAAAVARSFGQHPNSPTTWSVIRAICSPAVMASPRNLSTGFQEYRLPAALHCGAIGLVGFEFLLNLSDLVPDSPDSPRHGREG